VVEDPMQKHRVFFFSLNIVIGICTFWARGDHQPDMQKKSTRNRRLLLAISWLLSRLWSSLEISKLAIFRTDRENDAVRQLRQRAKFVAGLWVMQNNRYYFCAVSEGCEMLIKETQEIELN
jgi:hypothetical protein